MQLDDLRLILKVAELGSITAAAASLDIRTPTASAAIKRVEKALGTELFIRSTRQLRLSAAGERYLPRCQEALQLLEQARLEVQDDLDLVEGELRLSATSDLGRNLVAPWLDAFMEQHPKLRLRLHLGDSVASFYTEAVDLALRYGPPAEAKLYGFKICVAPRVVCASPAYVERFGAPQSPAELAEHNGLFYQLRDKLLDVWSFERGGEEFKVRLSGDRAANDGDLIRRWCLAGKGVALKSALDIAAELRSGQVLRLLPDYAAPPVELWLLFPSRQSITPAARLLREQLQERCQALLDELAAAGIIPAG